MRLQDVPSLTNEAARRVMDCALEVHRALGPGLKEADYRDCLVMELEDAGVSVRQEVRLRLHYKERVLLRGARVDLVVDDRLPVELKAVESLHPKHFLQTRSYVKFGGFDLGILVNFNEARLVDGWHRVLPGHFSPHVARVAVVAPSQAEPPEAGHPQRF
jgi:GxxExxY protein